MQKILKNIDAIKHSTLTGPTLELSRLIINSIWRKNEKKKQVKKTNKKTDTNYKTRFTQVTRVITNSWLTYIRPCDQGFQLALDNCK